MPDPVPDDVTAKRNLIANSAMLSATLIALSVIYYDYRATMVGQIEWFRAEMRQELREHGNKLDQLLQRGK